MAVAGRGRYSRPDPPPLTRPPARIAGLSGQGGSLAVGEPAHLTLVDPAASMAVDRDASVSLSRNNPWHGRTLQTSVVHTMFAGQLTVKDGALL